MELLLPAGNINSFNRAIHCGADAVYLGIQRFNARASADNFTVDNLKTHIDYAHLYGVSVYVAFNVAIKNYELAQAEQDIMEIARAGADAIIVADIGLIPIINHVASGLPIHISTQAGVNNLEGAKFFHKLGAERVVLARETTMQDIKNIKDNLDIELEYFVHGALCVSYSGGCLFSSIVNNNSGNRGACLQPCRLKYNLSNSNIEEEGYMLSTADLCLINRLDELKELGIDSIKIEGRLRRAEYVAQAAKSYRNVLDGVSNASDEIPYLMRVFNRGNFSEGYMFNGTDKIMFPNVQGHIGQVVGKVLKTFLKANYPYAEVSSCVKLTQGDGLKVLRDDLEVGGAELHSVGALSNDRYIIPISREVQVNDTIHLTTDSSINEELNNINRRIDLRIDSTIEIGKPLSLSLMAQGQCAAVRSDYIVQPAVKSPTSYDEIVNQLSKLNDTEFTLKDLNINMKSDVFIPKSKLNKLRRQGVQAIKISIINSYQGRKRVNHNKQDIKTYNKPLKKTIVAECKDTNQLIGLKSADAIVYNPYVIDKQAINELVDNRVNDINYYLALPKIIKACDIDIIRHLIPTLNDNNIGIYADNYSHIELARQYNFNFIAGIGLNIYNLNQVDLLYDADYIVASAELTELEAKPLLDRGCLLFSLGYLSIMTLAHCPNQLLASNSCSNCDHKSNLTYTDRKHSFAAKRSKVSACSFTVYNSIPHNLSPIVAREAYNMYLNLTDLQLDNHNVINALKSGINIDIKPSTSGNYIR